MTLDMNVAMWAIGVLIVIGMTYGDIRARLSRIEKQLGNGKPGIFVTNDAFQGLKDRVEILEERR